MAEQVKALVEVFAKESWHSFFFNGYAKKYPHIGYEGRMGVVTQGGGNSQPEEDNESQANNKAELKATIVVVLTFT